MLTRRQYLKNSALLAAASALPPGLLHAFESEQLITRAIPKTGEKLPIVGLGSSATFGQAARQDDVSALQEVLQALVENGGTVFDTAPSYGASEEVAGRIARERGLTEKIFWATKVNVAGRGGGRADPTQARAQLQRSFDYLGKNPIDLIQVHNLGDLPGQIPLIQEFKQDGRIRYTGTTVTQTERYGALEKAMRDYPIDFIGIDYAVDNRVAAESVLPLAAELGIAVLIYVPFGRNRLFSRVSGVDVPDWAREFGADSWGRFFLKYVAAHPAVTCVTPATSRATHMVDNMGAAYGELPDAAMLRRMEQFIESLPGG
ncbi:MAG: aldo/keto reductase [Gammaproteobacteria bacterium]|nr:aldo/keto reductase [Gammaproteobacteria bacterium]MDH5302662.1 aldo/keto reductase [Gammaproteobacteria bacterium]MDH5320901.1 aldo/keto reductase [Gammaproteobacteria bacterium]